MIYRPGNRAADSPDQTARLYGATCLAAATFSVGADGCSVIAGVAGIHAVVAT